MTCDGWRANPLEQMTHPLSQKRLLPRREFLWRFGGGLGGIALTHLLGEQGLLADVVGHGRPELNGGLDHRAKAKRVIQPFINGGARPIGTLHYKPEVSKHSRPEIAPRARR